jgi:hypothetical protein
MGARFSVGLGCFRRRGDIWPRTFRQTGWEDVTLDLDDLEKFMRAAEVRAAELERSFALLLDLIGEASAHIEAEYFQLPVADADAVYRERVYCYELYHQLRCLWTDFPFSLGGEIDKQGNPHFHGGPYAASVPDLLVHVPGTMDGNLAIVEAKSATGLGGTGDDLRKLGWFCDNARYFRGVFLIYGDAGDADRLSARIRRAGPDTDFSRVLCLYHRRVGNRAEQLQILGPD